MTTKAGRNSAAWVSRSSTELCAANAHTLNRARSWRTTSSAWVPTDPVEPIRLTVRIRSPEVHRLHHKIRGGDDEEQPVDAVEDAPVPVQDPAHVLDPEMPLDHGLAQITQRRHDRHDDPVERGLADRPRVDEMDDDHRDEDGGHRPADQPLPALVGTDGGGQLVSAHGRAHEERGDVVGDGDDHGGEDEGDAVTVREKVRIEQEGGERAEGAHPDEDED